MGRACTHLLVDNNGGYTEAFTGRGVESELLCTACAEAGDRGAVVDCCEVCRKLAATYRNGFVGTPQILVAPSALELATEVVTVPGCPTLLDLAPLPGADRNRWLGLAGDGRLLEIDLDVPAIREVARLGEPIELARAITIHVAPNRRFAAVVNTRGRYGAVVELETGRTTLPLVRDDYHPEHCTFPLAFVIAGERTLVVHATEWNRLDISDAATGEVVTARVSPAYEQAQDTPPHYLDYFHSRLLLSPAQTWIADAGWVWQPAGVLVSWSVQRWLRDNVWESEDGPSRRDLAWADDWDPPMCWLDDGRLLVSGYGSYEAVLGGAVIYDVTTGVLERWFALPGSSVAATPIQGPATQAFAFDRQLLVYGDGELSAWDVARGARVFQTATPLARFHPDAKCFVTLPDAGRVTIGRLGGHHRAASWNSLRVREVAAAIAGDLAGLPILADALEAAGCDDVALLAHCRTPGPHGARCWALAELGHSATSTTIGS